MRSRSRYGKPSQDSILTVLDPQGEQWSWRIVPEANGSSWHSGNILRPRAATRALVAEGEVEDLHGRDFHILEPHDTVVLITVELWKARAEDQQRGVRRFVKYLGMFLTIVQRCISVIGKYIYLMHSALGRLGVHKSFILDVTTHFGSSIPSPKLL